MKKSILALSMLALLGTSPVLAQARHRHHAPTVQVAPGNSHDDADDENVAYSDTASAASASADAPDESYYDHDSQVPDAVANNPLSFHNFDNPFAWFVALFTAGFGGIVLALIIILFVFTLLFAPFIILFMILRYLMRRHNDRVELAEKAMAAGVDVPEHMRPLGRQSNEYMWRQGVKNASVGFGLMVMFYFWEGYYLVGVGALILCLGIGKMVISRYSNPVNDSHCNGWNNNVSSRSDDNSNNNGNGNNNGNSNNNGNGGADDNSTNAANS